MNIRILRSKMKKSEKRSRKKNEKPIVSNSVRWRKKFPFCLLLSNEKDLRNSRPIM